MKLTKAQIRLLEALRDGDVLHRIGGSDPSLFLRSTMKSINWSTCSILEHAGLIEPFKGASHSLDPDYRITPTGRAALSSPERP